jgi:hypothetical protein
MIKCVVSDRFLISRENVLVAYHMAYIGASFGIVFLCGSDFSLLLLNIGIRRSIALLETSA